MHVAVGFMPAFKYRQKNSLIVFERGHKAHGYVSAGEASKIPTGGPPMTTRLSVTGDLLIWTIVNCHFYFEVAGIAAAESLGQVESFGVRMTHSKPPEQCKPEFCGFLAGGRACTRACKQPLTGICQDDNLGIAVV